MLAATASLRTKQATELMAMLTRSGYECDGVQVDLEVGARGADGTIQMAIDILG
ncbi:MAG: hypothetical protein Q7T26_02695 [Dehalococcoidia bacterium]|nr:hypothetical protein [Dehalococcoidia bacterium]